MIHIKICPVQYRVKGTKTFKKGIQIINRNSNITRFIDAKTMKDVSIAPGNLDYYVSLESSEGNILFNLSER